MLWLQRDKLWDGCNTAEVFPVFHRFVEKMKQSEYVGSALRALCSTKENKLGLAFQHT